MRIKMLSTAAGPDFSAQPGMVIDVSISRAEALIRGGFAVQVDSAPASMVETASIDAPERAVQPKPRKKVPK